MSVTSIVSGLVIDITKKFIFDKGKKVAHEFKESVSGNTLGKIISHRKKEKNNSVILFIHGFSGSSAETFGAVPKLLINNSKLDGYDVFSVGYSSDIFPSIGKGLWSVNPDITKVSKYLNTTLNNQFFEYEQVVFVAHSMGGLVVQRAILDMDSVTFNKISHVLFFGTPSAGLKKATWFRFWNRQIRDLSSNSNFVINLRKDWEERFNDTYSFKFRTVAGSKDEFVPVSSSLDPFNEKYHDVIEGNHVTMIQTINDKDVNNQCYQVILGSITNKSSSITAGTDEERNILFGNYQAIISKYLANYTQISLMALSDLVFALECTGRAKKALDVLETHPEAHNDSDTLGIIGGRYKRNYILNGIKNDLDKAIEYYTRGLTISTENDDKKQQYYHAINLAFLNIFGLRDKGINKMKKYAALALANCDMQSKNMWELATIAEANLYLENFDVSKTYYEKAAKVAGTDIRAKQSIYSNAYFGFQSLMGSRNEKADFLIMLEECLLR